MCALEIRRLARFMKIACLLHYHEKEFDPELGPTPAMLNIDFAE